MERRVKDAGETAALRRAALGAEPRWTSAMEWLQGSRRAEVAAVLSEAVQAYFDLENSHPPEETFGGVNLKDLPREHPLPLTWPLPTHALRMLMVHAGRILRSFSTLVSGGGSELTVTLPMLGRPLLETVATVKWLVEPWRVGEPADPPAQLRLVAARAMLVDLAGRNDLLRESREFEMDDLPTVTASLAEGHSQAAQVFSGKVDFRDANSAKWVIDGEVRHRIGQMVGEVGSVLFPTETSHRTHYLVPSLRSHGSLGSDMGTHIKIVYEDHHDNVFVLDPKAVEGWTWYHLVWFRWAAELMAALHGWSSDRLSADDEHATDVFGRRPFVPASLRS